MKIVPRNADLTSFHPLARRGVATPTTFRWCWECIWIRSQPWAADPPPLERNQIKLAFVNFEKRQIAKVSKVVEILDGFTKWTHGMVVVGQPTLPWNLIRSRGSCSTYWTNKLTSAKLGSLCARKSISSLRMMPSISMLFRSATKDVEQHLVHSSPTWRTSDHTYLFALDSLLAL